MCVYIKIEQIKNRYYANARRRLGVNAALPRYSDTMITIIYVCGTRTAAYVARLACPNLRPLVPDVSADLQRFTARQNLTELSRLPVFLMDIAFRSWRNRKRYIATLDVQLH